MTISIETGNAGTYPDVDEAQLLGLCDGIDDLEFVIVHDSERPDEYAQAAGPDKKDGTYVVEHHTSDDRHYQANVATTTDVSQLLAAWARQRDGWDEGYVWTELEELRGANQPQPR